MKSIKILLAICLLFNSCNKEGIDGVRVYKILEGKHYSKGIKGEELTSKTLYFRAMFTPSTVYHIATSDSLDLNKPFIGFCDCNSTIHRNSARFGSRYLSGQMEITTYVYNNKVRVKETILGRVNIGEWHYYSITLTDEEYIFRMDMIEVSEKRTNKCDRGFYKLTYPYQGGDIPAWRDMKILIEIL